MNKDTRKTVESALTSQFHLHGGLHTSDRVALRRFGGQDPYPMAFWKLLHVLEHIDDAPMHIGETEYPQWMALFQGIAALDFAREAQHWPTERLGHALGLAGYSELRLSQLLRATPERLPTMLRQTVTFLVSKGHPCHIDGLMRLLLSTQEHAKRTRDHIASDYFKTLHSTEQHT